MYFPQALRLLPLVLLLPVFTGVSGCRKSETQATTPNAGAVKEATLRIGMDVWPGYYGLLLADEKGFLTKRGLAVEVTFPEDTHRMVADFAAGRYDGICASLGDLILPTRVDQELRMILCTDESAGADQILGAPELLTAQGLRGKRITTTLGGFGELFVRRFVESRGLTPEDVSIINADAAEAPRLFKAKEADAAHTWEPYAGQCREAGQITLFTSADAHGLIFDGFFVHTQDFVPHGDALRALCAAWIEANEWWLSHPEEGTAIVEKRLAAMKAPDLHAGLAGIRLKTKGDNHRLFDVNNEDSLHKSVQIYTDFFLKRGTLGKRITSQEVLDSRFVQ